jgi:putative glutamine amidotransferase
MALDETGRAPRPLVGITSGAGEILRPGVGSVPAHYIDRTNPHAVVQAGGDPVLLPSVRDADEEAPERYAQLLDGFVISGGADIAPSAYGRVDPPEGVGDHDPVRDTFEIALVRAARRRGKPILGICRGMEVLNVAYGGGLAEVRHTLEPVALDGFDRVVVHTIELVPGSVAATAYGSDHVDVWCLHHQAPSVVGESLIVTGRSADGVVEVIEGDPKEGFLLGVLFHPEFMLARNPLHLRPYQALVEAARERGLRAPREHEVDLYA